MDENKLKAIVEEVVNKAVDPIKQQLGGIEGRLDDPGTGLVAINKRLDGIEGRLDDSDTGLAAINRRLDANTAAVVELESTVKGYGDMYKINKSNIERLDDRVAELEENASITPPPELVIQR